MDLEKTELELLKDELERVSKERDQMRAEVEKLSLLYEAEKEYWLPIVMRLDNRTLAETLNDYDNLKERMAGNMAGKNHLSDKLQQLRQVAEAVWATVDIAENSTHPKNNVAESRLVGLGWRGGMARVGARIIRPSWARKGRPGEE